MSLKNFIFISFFSEFFFVDMGTLLRSKQLEDPDDDYDDDDNEDDKTITIKEYTCSICSMKFYSQMHYIEHTKNNQCGQAHRPYSYFCPMCPFRSLYKRDIKVHYNRKHNIDGAQSTVILPTSRRGGEHKCYQCNKSYRHQKNLRRHVRDECGVEPKFSCQLCSYRAKHKSSLQSHINHRHTVKPKITATYTCPPKTELL